MRTDWSVSIRLCVVLLAGCAGIRPDGDSAAKWEAALPAESATAERPAAQGPALQAVPIRKDRLTVEEAVADGLAHNRIVKQSRLGALISGTFETEARSRLLPTLSGRARFTRVDTPPKSDAPELGTSFSIGPRSVWSGELNLDFVALAALVKTELDAIRTFINAHTHITTATISSGPPGVLAAPTPPLGVIGSVAASDVEAT